MESKALSLIRVCNPYGHGYTQVMTDRWIYPHVLRYAGLLDLSSNSHAKAIRWTPPYKNPQDCMFIKPTRLNSHGTTFHVLAHQAQN